MTQEKSYGSRIVCTILAIFSPLLVIAIIVALVSSFIMPVKGAVTPEEKVEYRTNFEKDIEPLIAKDTFSREILKRNPEKLVEYMHITDVLYGTDLCNGVEEDTLIMQLKADPLLTSSFSERYFQYLDEKYK